MLISLGFETSQCP